MHLILPWKATFMPAIASARFRDVLAEFGKNRKIGIAGGYALCAGRMPVFQPGGFKTMSAEFSVAAVPE
jgi:hypothetical protein